MRLLLRPAAVSDMQSARLWYEARQPGLGNGFLEAVERRMAQIESTPLLFPVVRGVTRRAIVVRFPYGIFYIAEADVVSVLAVMHHAREPLQWGRRG